MMLNLKNIRRNMSIEYDLFANPPRNGEEKPTLHARAINIQTVNTNELARMIESMSTFTTADIKRGNQGNQRTVVLLSQ